MAAHFEATPAISVCQNQGIIATGAGCRTFSEVDVDDSDSSMEGREEGLICK